MSSRPKNSKGKPGSSSTLQKTKPSEYCLPVKKRNNSQLAVNLKSMTMQDNTGCCRGHGNRRNQICQKCLQSLSNIVDTKENMVKTTRKSTKTARKSVEKNITKKITSPEIKNKKQVLVKKNPEKSNVDKYTLLKLQEINKSQIIQELRQPVARLEKKVISSVRSKRQKNSKKSSRNTSRLVMNINDQAKEDSTFEIAEVNPFENQERLKQQSPTFSGQNTKNQSFTAHSNFIDETKQFSFQIQLEKIEKEKVKSHLENMIEQLKDTNSKLKDSLFQSYQKYTCSLEKNHQEIRKINQQNTQKTSKLNEEVQSYKIKWKKAENTISEKQQERRNMVQKNKRQVEKIRKELQDQSKKEKDKYQENVRYLERRICQKNQTNALLNQKIQSMGGENTKLKLIIEQNEIKISNMSLQIKKLQVDNEIDKQKIGKMTAEKEFILQNSRTVLNIIQKQLKEGEQKFEEVDKNNENMILSKLTDQNCWSPKKNVLGISNY